MCKSMQLPTKAFLEQIIDDTAIFEYVLEDYGKEEQTKVLQISVHPEKVEALNVGYYYDLDVSAKETPYKIYDGVVEAEKYVNLQIDIDYTEKQQHIVRANYETAYLLSRFFSNIYFAREAPSKWVNLINIVKDVIHGDMYNVPYDKENARALKTIVEQASSIQDVISKYYKMPIDLDEAFSELTKLSNIGKYYASLILHVLYPEKAMIYNKDCYKLLGDYSLLEHNDKYMDYQSYSNIICDRIKKFDGEIMKVNLNDRLTSASWYIKNFDYADFLRGIYR